MSMVKQLALRSVHKVSEIKKKRKKKQTNCFTCANNVWSPAKFIINNNAKMPVLVNLFNMTVFKTKIKVKRAKLIFFCLVVSSILFVFAGYKIMALLSHQSDASFMLLCI